jgi:chaperonin GroES
MSFRPIGDRLVVKRHSAERMTPGGIALPDTGEKPSQGTVIAVGKGRILEDGRVRPMDIRTGDHVLFGQHSGTEVIVDGESVLVMREEDVTAIIEVA